MERNAARMRPEYDFDQMEKKMGELPIISELEHGLLSALNSQIIF